MTRSRHSICPLSQSKYFQFSPAIIITCNLLIVQGPRSANKSGNSLTNRALGRQKLSNTLLQSYHNECEFHSTSSLLRTNFEWADDEDDDVVPLCTICTSYPPIQQQQTQEPEPPSRGISLHIWQPLQTTPSYIISTASSSFVLKTKRLHSTLLVI